MPTKLRLGLALSSIKRIFAEVATDDGNRILTQSLDSLTSQVGEFFVTQDALVSGDFVDSTDPLITQNGDFLALNQNPFQILLLNQDVADPEAAEDLLSFLLSEAGQFIITQDDKRIALQHDPATTGNSITAQDGSFLITQDGQTLITEQAS